MDKRPRRTTDNFIIKRSSDSLSTGPTSGPGLDRANLTSVSRKAPTERRQLGSTYDSTNAALEQSLSAIDNESQEKESRRRFRRHKNKVGKGAHKSRRKKIVGIIVLALVLIIVLSAGYFIWKTFMVGGKVFNGNPLSIFHKQRLVQDANGRTNVLIFGTSGYTMDEKNGWDGGLLTDSIMVLSINQDAHDAFAISLPRDLYVQHSCKGSLGTTAGRLNETYYCAYVETNSQEEGAKALMQKAGEITGLDVQYYAHANWSALKDGVDAVGGVDVKIESNDPRGIYDVATGIKFKKDEVVHMNGDTALAFSRARNSEGGYGLPGSNFDREKNQQRLLTALQKKIVSANTLLNPVAISRLLDTLGDNLRTNFKTEEIQALIDATKGVSAVTPLPFNGRADKKPDLVKGGNVGGAAVLFPVAGLYDYSDIQAYIKGSIKGTLNVTIDILNGSDVPGIAQQKANDLEAAGYQVGAISNSPFTITDKVQLYRLNTDESKNTATASLEKLYSITAQAGAPKGYTSKDNADFVLIFGAQQ